MSSMHADGGLLMCCLIPIPCLGIATAVKSRWQTNWVGAACVDTHAGLSLRLVSVVQYDTCSSMRIAALKEFVWQLSTIDDIHDFSRCKSSEDDQPIVLRDHFYLAMRLGGQSASALYGDCGAVPCWRTSILSPLR